MIDKPLQSALGGPNLAAIYHNWFEGHAAKAGEAHKGSDEASAQDVVDVRSGKNPLPPGATLILDLEPLPHGCQQLYWPTWHFRALSEDGSVVAEGDLSNENHAVDGFVGIQAPDREEGVWNKSSGYRLICGLDDKLPKCKLEISGEVGGIASKVTTIPWVSHP